MLSDCDTLKYAVTAKKQLEEAEQSKLRLEEERSREAEKARKETEASKHLMID